MDGHSVSDDKTLRWCLTCPVLKVRADLDLSVTPEGAVHVAACPLRALHRGCTDRCLEQLPGRAGS